MSKPITLYSHTTGPNPWKVYIFLEELGIPYTVKLMEFPDLKKEPYEKINPNGRVPAIEDPNTGLTIWESGAIIEYLIDQYDKSNKLSYGDKSPEKYQCKSWLYFQVSGQGPYFGQKAWFTMFHPEKIQSAQDRYANEIKRVFSVVDRHLKDNGTGWLVGNKCTYADLAWVPWDMFVPMLMGPEGQKVFDDHPYLKKWHETMMARPAVAKMAEERAKAMAK